MTSNKEHKSLEISSVSKDSETKGEGEEKEESKLPFVSRNFWIRFTPALVVWPVWIYLMCQDGGQWNQVFSNYYAASIAMALGSFVAGSTPLGGGVVAFPVSVLVLGLTSEGEFAHYKLQSTRTTTQSHERKSLKKLERNSNETQSRNLPRRALTHVHLISQSLEMLPY